MVTRRKAGICAAAMLAVLVLSPATTSQPVQAQPDDTRLAHFDAALPGSTSVVDYALIDRILTAFVVDDGSTTTVRYSVLKGDGLRVLEQIFTGFGSVDTTRLNRDEQLAYWLNLRMLMVMYATAEAYPAAKPAQLLAANGKAITTPMVTIAGVRLSIADVDRIILSKAGANPHVVYGMVVPVKEAPAFPKVAFRGATVHGALEAAGRTFVNRRGMIKVSQEVATVPRVFTGYRIRLGQDDAALLAHIKALAAPKLAQQLTSATQLSEATRFTLNNFAERSFSSFAGPELHSSDQRGGAGS
jgi:hypothetical protein